MSAIQPDVSGGNRETIRGVDLALALTLVLALGPGREAVCLRLEAVLARAMSTARHARRAPASISAADRVSDVSSAANAAIVVLIDIHNHNDAGGSSGGHRFSVCWLRADGGCGDDDGCAVDDGVHSAVYN